MGVLLLQVAVAQAAFLEHNTFTDLGSNAPVTNVEGLLYACNDIQECRTVQNGVVFSGNSGSGNQLTIVYPDTPQINYYGEYFYQACRIPMEFLSFSSGSGEISYTTQFEQAADCRSPVDLKVTNTAFVNEPVQIGIDADIATRTTSAFRENQIAPFFIPPNHEDHYSAETQLDVTVKNSVGTTVFSDRVDLNLFMDTQASNNFLWMPLVAGTYTIEAKTTVTDCQCSNNIPQTSNKVITVLPARPLNQCFTILNDLTSDNQFPEEGEQVFYTVEKISNFMDAAGVITPLASNLAINVSKDGQVVQEINLILPANPDGNAKKFSFPITFAQPGQHGIQITGIGASCPGGASANIQDVISKDVVVNPEPKLDLFFTVFDVAGGTVISGATVTISNGVSGVTGADGKLTLQDFSPGQFTYTITHPNFVTVQDDFTISLTDITFNIQMQQVNAIPTLLPISDQMAKVGVPIVLDLDDFANDIDDTQSSLVFTATHDTSIVSVLDPNTHVLTLTATSETSTLVIITVTDPRGAVVTTTFTAMFVSCMSNSDCPVDGVVGNAFCDVNGDAANTFRDHTCSNPATMQATCTFVDTSQVIDACGVGEVCENAVCQSVACSLESQCGIDGFITIDACDANDDVSKIFRDFSCTNAGSANSTCGFVDTRIISSDCGAGQTCENAACANVACSVQTDCGTDGFLGNSFCDTAGGVSDTFRDFTCNLGGSANSTCSSTDTIVQTTICSPGSLCENGACQTVTCTVDSQCGTDTFLGNAFCGTSGNVEDTFRNFSCSNSGTVNSTCGFVDSIETVQICGATTPCFNGSCQTLACIVEADCGVDGFLGNPVCDINGNAADTFRDHTCSNGGTLNATCSFTDALLVSDTCTTTETCIAGVCTGIACTTSADCGTIGVVGSFFCQGRNKVQTSRSFSCSNPGTLGSACSSSDSVVLIEECRNGCSNGACNNKEVEGLRIDHIRIVSGGVFRGDDLFQTVVTMNNNGDVNLKRLQLTAYFPAFGELAKSRHFDLKKGDKISRKIFLQLPGIEPGLHTVRFTISNDKVRRVVHRDILIQ
jgi:hypothetical protein